MYDICPVCFWEDSGLDIVNLDNPSSCNHGLTLRQGRDNFRRLGACEAGMVRNVCPEEQRRKYKHVPRQ